MIQMIRSENLERRYTQVKSKYHELLDDIYRRGATGRYSQVFNYGQVFNGHYTSIVEHKLQKLSGRKHALLTSSCSISMYISMLASGIGAGDEVIITAYSCPASETYVHLCGATAVFCEVNETGNMDASLIKSLITDKTRAITATGLYGDMHDHATISKLCKDHGLLYVNDAAQSMFSTQNGVDSLSTGDIVCMSFAENKPLPSLMTGGALLTDNTNLYYQFLHLRNHGKPSRRSPYTHFGVRGVPDEDLGAQLLCTMECFDEWQTRRGEIAEYYDTEFKRLGVTTRPHSPEWNYHKYAIMFEDKFIAQEQLAKLGVESFAHYADILPQKGSFPMSDRFVKQSLSIPINGHLTDSEVEKVVEVVNKVWKSSTT